MKSDLKYRDLPCQLCHQPGLKKFEIEGSSTLWLCESCELYQYGQIADDSAYAAEYHAGYEKNRNKKIRTGRIRLNRVASMLPTPENSRKFDLLDIGCSVGATLEAASYFPCRAVGVDVSADAVAYCQERGLNAQQVEGLALPFDSDSFDVVVNWHVLEHVEDVRKTLREWRRVLKPGGILFLETPDAASPKVRRRGSSYRKFWAPEHTYTFTYPNLSQFLAEEGLEVLEGPWIGDLRNHGWSFAPYSLGNRVYHGFRRLAGIQKEFQIFARKPVDESASELRTATCAA